MKRFLFPGLIGKDLKLTHILLDNAYLHFLNTVFLIVWRIQMAATFGNMMPTKEVQGMPSMKENAKLIAKLARPIAVAVAVSRTLSYDPVILNPENDKSTRAVLLRETVENLIAEKPYRGSAVLKPNQINTETLGQHRQGIVSSLIGTWQSKALFDPRSVLTGIPPTTVTLKDVIDMAQDILSQTSQTTPPLTNPDEELKAVENALTEILSEFPHPINDGVYLNPTNLFPLEANLGVQRTGPSVIIAPPPISLDDTDPLLVAANEQAVKLSKTLRKAPSPPLAPPAVLPIPAAPPSEDKQRVSDPIMADIVPSTKLKREPAPPGAGSKTRPPGRKARGGRNG